MNPGLNARVGGAPAASQPRQRTQPIPSKALSMRDILRIKSDALDKFHHCVDVIYAPRE